MALDDHDILVATGSEFDDDDFLGVQVDSYGKDGGGPPIELHHQFGFHSRPLDPDPDGTGCQTHRFAEGSREHAMLSCDPRVIPKLPRCGKGESIQYGGAGNFVRCHADGRVTLFTTSDGTPNGKSVYLEIAPDGFAFVAPWGKITFDRKGFHVKTTAGARLDMGGVPALPAPFSSFGSYASLQAATCTINGSVVQLGPSTPAGYQPAAFIPYHVSLPPGLFVTPCVRVSQV